MGSFLLHPVGECFRQTSRAAWQWAWEPVVALFEMAHQCRPLRGGTWLSCESHLHTGQPVPCGYTVGMDELVSGGRTVITSQVRLLAVTASAARLFPTRRPRLCPVRAIWRRCVSF